MVKQSNSKPSLLLLWCQNAAQPCAYEISVILFLGLCHASLLLCLFRYWSMSRYVYLCIAIHYAHVLIKTQDADSLGVQNSELVSTVSGINSICIGRPAMGNRLISAALSLYAVLNLLHSMQWYIIGHAVKKQQANRIVLLSDSKEKKVNMPTGLWMQC